MYFSYIEKKKNLGVVAQTCDPGRPRPDGETLSQKSLRSTLRIHHVNRFVRSHPGFQLIFLDWMTQGFWAREPRLPHSLPLHSLAGNLPRITSLPTCTWELAQCRGHLLTSLALGCPKRSSEKPAEVPVLGEGVRGLVGALSVAIRPWFSRWRRVPVSMSQKAAGLLDGVHRQAAGGLACRPALGCGRA